MPHDSKDENYTKALTQTAISLPIHRALGLSLISQAPTPVPSASLEFITKSIHLNPAQTVHGGIAQLVIDTACFLAVIPTLSMGQGAGTIASSFQLLTAVSGLGKRYEVEGRVVRRGKAILFCQGEVWCDGKLVATGSVTKVITASKTEFGKSRL